MHFNQREFIAPIVVVYFSLYLPSIQIQYTDLIVVHFMNRMPDAESFCFLIKIVAHITVSLRPIYSDLQRHVCDIASDIALIKC